MSGGLDYDQIEWTLEPLQGERNIVSDPGKLTCAMTKHRERQWRLQLASNRKKAHHVGEIPMFSQKGTEMSWGAWQAQQRRHSQRVSATVVVLGVLMALACVLQA